MQKELITSEVTLSYKKLGAGKPVLLLHGFAEDSEVWDAQIEYLKSDYQLIVPDLPGTAHSKFNIDISENTQLKNLDFYADLIRKLMDHEQITKFTMLGHSMGGYITLAFAEKFPGFLNGFGLIHSTAFADNDAKKKTRAESIRFLENNRSYDLLKNSLPNLFSSSFKARYRDKVKDFIDKYSEIKPEVLQLYTAAMQARPDRSSVLENAEVPVLFIIGDEDPAAPLDDLLKQVKLPKISYIHVLKQTGHMGMIENSAKVNDFVLEYLQESLR